MQHLREILREMDLERACIRLQMEKNTDPMKVGVFQAANVGLDIARAFILRKITELEEKGEC